MVEVYICFCLHDTCLLSYEAYDPYPALIGRVSIFLNDEYKKKKLTGLCSCRLCRPPRYNSGYWNLRLYSSTVEFRHVCCNDQAYRSLINMPEPSQDELSILNRICLNTYILSRYSGDQKYPSCYFCWNDELITLNNFCNPCKMHCLRSRYFKPQIISKDNNGALRTKR